MDTIKFDKKETRVIAHRGLSGLEKENTNSAFVAAGNRSYYGIETDIHKTKDGHFVINHDGDFNRVAGENVVIENSTLEEIQKVILYDTDGTKGRNDLRPTTLQNYISICKKYGKRCVLEVKNTFPYDDLVRMVEEIRALGYLEGVIFISFSRENCINLRKLLPMAEIQFLCDKVDEQTLELLCEYRLDLDVAFPAVTRELVDRLHAAGLKINCWTVDKKEVADRLIEWGVDFITTNILE